MNNMSKNYFQLRKMPCALFCMIMMSFLTVSCLEKDVYQGTDDKGDSENTANLFDYSTKKNLTINLDYSKNYQIPFEIYYSNPLNANGSKNKSMQYFISGLTDLNGKFTMKYDALPAGTKEIYVYSPTAFVTPLIKVQVEGDVVNIVDGKSVASLKTTRADASPNGAYYTGWKPRKCEYAKPLGDWNEDGYPSYLNKSENIKDISKYQLKPTPKFERVITNTLNDENKSYGMYLTHQYIDISEKANVFINFVEHNAAGKKNSLAYYTLSPSESEPTTAPTNLAIAFPNLAADGLRKGDLVQLKYFDKSANQWTVDFPKGARIGLVLLVDAFENANLKETVNLMYSSKRYNAYTITQSTDGDGSIGADRPQMLAFMADDNLVLSFEDMPWHEKRVPGQDAHADFSDDIFTITANPVEALPDVEPGIDPEVKEEPDMTVKATGILAFEDNWPSAGDYDLNDVVFAYQRTFNIKFAGGDMTLLSIDEVYTFRNDGATFKNGFGYEIGANIKREDVEVTVTSDKKCTGQGLDPDLEKATVMLIDNTKGLEVGTTFKVHTELKNHKYSYMDMSFTPYNPFVVSMGYGNGNFLNANRVEVHLPKNYAPTPKADESKFGTENDKSLVDGSNFYYIRSGDYPFALEIVGAFGTTDIPDFRIPEENKAIDVSYPKFNDWVKNPFANADWWK